MSRPDAPARTSLAAERLGRDIESPGVRQEGARRLAALLRFVLLPFQALLAVVAGAVFLVLLPICGVATLAEGTSKACWREVRGALSQAPRDKAPQH
jgi:hypothetical protein